LKTPSYLNIKAKQQNQKAPPPSPLQDLGLINSQISSGWDDMFVHKRRIKNPLP